MQAFFTLILGIMDNWILFLLWQLLLSLINFDEKNIHFVLAWIVGVV